MTSDNLLDPTPTRNVSLGGGPFVESRTDHMGHGPWKDGVCGGCKQPMSKMASVRCPAEVTDEDKRGVELLVADAHRDVDVRHDALGLVAALETHAIPGNAVAALRKLKTSLGMP